MKKLLLAITLTLSLGTVTSHAWSYTYEDFHSWNKPMNPRMASPNEMKAYHNDLKQYLHDMDQEIKKIQAKKEAAITEYNKVATEYNQDDFFHNNSKVKIISTKKTDSDFLEDKNVGLLILNLKEAGLSDELKKELKNLINAKQGNEYKKGQKKKAPFEDFIRQFMER